MGKLSDSRRKEFEEFMAERFEQSIDRRRCKNGDGNDYMSWDMNVARAVWQHLSQRAEAAEAKLAELQKQPPVAWTDDQELRDVKNHGCGYLFTVDPVTPNADPRRIINLFTRTAPAINLAELAPDGWKLVPVEPTTEMLEEIWLDERFKEVAMKRRYQALLAAAPSLHE